MTAADWRWASLLHVSWHVQSPHCSIIKQWLVSRLMGGKGPYCKIGDVVIGVLVSHDME